MDEIDPKEVAFVHAVVRKLYKKYCLPSKTPLMTKEGMIQYGFLGLESARREFDSTKGLPFLQYASIKICRTIITELRRGGTIRLPQDRYKELKVLKRAKAKLEADNLQPHIDNLINITGWTEEKIQNVESLESSVFSSDEFSVDAFLFKSQGRAPQELQMLKKDLGIIMTKCMDGLGSSLKLLLAARVLEKVTLKCLAQQMSCSIETVRNREKQAKEQMKACLKRHGWSLT
ncbi:MAG: sigma-70 family RNA polymerase sigma factor [Desulfobacter sp.]